MLKKCTVIFGKKKKRLCRFFLSVSERKYNFLRIPRGESQEGSYISFLYFTL